MVNDARMIAQLELHEGLRTKAYLDTEGNLTIGIGYNVTSRGWEALEEVCGRSLVMRATDDDLITADEARRMCAADVARIQSGLPHMMPWWPDLDEVRQRVFVDLTFNMGARVLGFKQMLACAARRDWSGAVKELFKSKWAFEVGDGPGKRWDRADRLSKMLLTGQDYTV